jgi:imidazole glycerol-phosphate synthase subunit HisH
MNAVTVIDYGAGNLRNVCKALEFVGAQVTLTADPDVISASPRVVLPGVGAFAHCMDGLTERNLVDATLAAARSGRPFLGICVGMQLLFDISEEMGEWPGLGLIPGRVVRFDVGALKVPHIGWNQVRGCKACHPILQGVQPDGYAYFVHSFHAAVPDSRHIVAMSDYGYDFPAVVAKDNIWGIQFHPEKSQDVGLTMLKNFVEQA